MKAKLAKELVARLPNEIGALAKLSKIIAEKGINILAVSTWVEGIDAVVRIITSDNVRVLEALKRTGIKIRQTDVVVVEAVPKPGVLRCITEKLAKHEIDLFHLYATGSESHSTSILVFSSTNNDRAVVVLNEKNAARGSQPRP